MDNYISRVKYTFEPKTCDDLFSYLTSDKHKWFDEKELKKIRRRRSLWVHRGLNQNYPLETSLFRLKGDNWKLEAHILRNFYKYGRAEHQQSHSFWYWLALAQHHELPTRLLDWTFSPLVALHFATSNSDHFDKDGSLWSMHRVSVHDYLPEDIGNILKKEKAFNFTVEMLSSITKMSSKFEPQGSLESFDKHEDPKKFVLFFEPPSIDLRIVNQYAIFSVMNCPQTQLEDWIKSHMNTYRKIRIPAKLKLEIRDRLDSYNLTERVFFPGLDGTAKWLKRHYTKIG